MPATSPTGEYANQKARMRPNARKRLRGFAQVRYKGLAKNANRVFTALAMVNLYMAATRVPALARP